MEYLNAGTSPQISRIGLGTWQFGSRDWPFLAKLDLDKLRIGLDPKSTAIHALHARGLPTSLVVDADGKVLGKVEGAAEWDSDEMVARVTKLMPPVSPER